MEEFNLNKRIKQNVAKKTINGQTIYKVIDLLDGEIANVRAVRRNGSDFNLMLDLTRAEEKFVFDDMLVELESGYERDKAIKSVKEYEKKVEYHLKNVLESTALIDTEAIDIRTIAGHTYAIVHNVQKEGVPIIHYVYGDMNGRIYYNGPLPSDLSIHGLIMFSLVNQPYDKNNKYPDEQVYQIGPNEYLLLAEYKDLIVTVPMLLQEEKDGELSWTTNVDLLRFIELDKDNQPVFIDKPEDVFPEISDAHKFMGEKTKGVTERVILKN